MNWNDEDDVKAYHKIYYENHKDYYKTYNEKHKKEQKIRRDSHLEEAKTRSKTYYAMHREEHKAYCKSYRSKHSVDITCLQCGKNFKLYIYANDAGKFCSRECANKWKAGSNSVHWRGGISFAPYCPKFNDNLKEEVRNNFGRRCFLSGKIEKNRKLAVHHCDYLKSQGCQGQRWSLLPLDHSWHTKTNHNRWYWFALLRDYWVYKYITFHGMDIFDGPDRTAWLWEMYDK